MQLTEEITLVLWRKGGGRREDTDAYFRRGDSLSSTECMLNRGMVVCVRAQRNVWRASTGVCESVLGIKFV